jgi:hypothetical protein
MKKTMAISFLTVLFLLGQSPATVAAGKVSNNEMMKQCLDVWGFDRDEPNIDKRFSDVNMMDIAGCVQGFRAEAWAIQIEKDREFVKSRPWFRGSNFKWQERAEYTCTKHLHTGQTICQKPYYVN